MTLEQRTPGSQGQVRPAVIYARVSSKEQEREGFSMPAQLNLLRSYTLPNGLSIAQEFEDVETAKQAGRSGFGQMISFLKKNNACRVLVVEKTDRLYRNFRDLVTIDELGLEIHFVKENVVLSPDSRSSEKFMHGIKVLMAKNYIDNLSEETRKGMLEKARQGIWPSYAPLGFLNVLGSDGKRTIVPDPILAPIIKRLYEQYATGKHSLKDMVRTARADGFTYRKSGDAVPKSTIHKILRNRIYSGDFEFDGMTYHGTYEPIVSRELWERVQIDSRWPDLEEDAGRQSERSICLPRPDQLRPLRLRAGRRDQEEPIRVLPLHWLQRQVPGAIYAARGAGEQVH